MSANNVELYDLISNVTADVAGRSAILERLAEYHETFEASGVNHELDHAFWDGVRALMEANRTDLGRLAAYARQQVDKPGD